ncbi:hypothetical protein SAMN05444354_106254 [Stigmatella aurantiaca]|uniref:Uncharacterized protein n=1 Tax=Stigmatella aurantiaca TaxID=41 RepID=A0A1H7QS70_STIAU|nr:hypothetical protein [Stigmatella aurantiaca]SEL50831.1 hypothetical protein SAMN05444354_106254 [Stigmatella aurantiaca]
MWKRSSVVKGRSYYVALCQGKDGQRYYELCEVDAHPQSTDAIFYTQPVPHELLLKGDYEGISQAVQLTNGCSFAVEAHGIWLTEEEIAVLEGDEDEENVPWLNGLPPIFPPK